MACRHTTPLLEPFLFAFLLLLLAIQGPAHSLEMPSTASHSNIASRRKLRPITEAQVREARRDRKLQAAEPSPSRQAASAPISPLPAAAAASAAAAAARGREGGRAEESPGAGAGPGVASGPAPGAAAPASAQGRVRSSGAQAPGAGREASPVPSFCDVFVKPTGLQCQEHQVITRDGYILSLHRIRCNPRATPRPVRGTGGGGAGGGGLSTLHVRGARGGNLSGLGSDWTPGAQGNPTRPASFRCTAPAGGRGRPPVLLDHALVLGGDLWFGLANGSRVARDPLLPLRLPVLLARNGFDVWVAHHRGTQYSPGHLRYTTQDWEYWEWDWDQLVDWDCPALMGYVANATGHPQLHYVGFNQGAVLPLALAARFPHAASALASVVSIAPPAYLHNVTSPSLRLWAERLTPFVSAYHATHALEGHLNWTNTQAIVGDIERATGVDLLCSVVPSGRLPDLVSNVSGPACCTASLKVPPTPDHNWLATSFRNLLHYQQAISSRASFERWDGGLLYNVATYGSPFPPLYEPDQIPANTSILVVSGENDWFADQKGVSRLVSSLPNAAHIAVANFSHLDLVLGSRAHLEVFSPVLVFLNRPRG